MTPSDEELLKAFAKSHDEQAFRCLAERYSGLIFHTALRTLNDRTLAEDVSQRVLGVLARKAPQVCRENAPLPSWLHRTTILEARSARRIESRHHRKKDAIMRAPADSPDSDDPAWKDALPHLDAAIDTLPESDRHVLLLHYVNELTFPEIAARLGKSAAAVQKQSRRALEKLQSILGRRGVALSIGILTAGLNTEMAKAGPVLLIPALSSLGKTTTSVLLVKKSTVAAIGVTVLLCGVPLAHQQATFSRLESKWSAASGIHPEARISSRPVNAKSPSLLERLARDLNSKSHDMLRYLAAVDHIEAFSSEELIGLMKQTAVSPMSFANRQVVIGTIFDTLAKRDPESALNAAFEHVPPEMIGRSLLARLQSGMISFSQQDGQRALAWFHGHLDQIRTIPGVGGDPDGRCENVFRMGLAVGLLFSNPADAGKLLNHWPKHEIKERLAGLARSAEASLQKDKSGFIQIARETLPENDVGEAIAFLCNTNIEIVHDSAPSYAAVEDLLEKHEFSPRESQTILRRSGATRMHSALNSQFGLAASVVQYKAFLAGRQPENAIDRLVGETIGVMVLTWPDAADRVHEVMSDPGSVGLGDDAITGLLNTVGSRFGLERTEMLTALIADRKLAAEYIKRIKSPGTE